MALTDSRMSAVGRPMRVDLERQMINARRSAIALELAGELETAAVYTARVDMLLDEWALTSPEPPRARHRRPMPLPREAR